eukprot:3253281-Karenia_brevis.AAC.1
MSFERTSVWAAKVSIFHMLCGSKSGVRLRPRAENELRVGFSMGMTTINFPYVLTFRERGGG